MVVMKLLALMLRNPSCGLYRPLRLLEKVITDFGHEFYTEGYVHGDIRGVNVAARQTQRLLVPVRSALGWAGMSFGKSRPHDARKVFQPCQAI